MKKIHLKVLTVFLVGGFILSFGAQSIMAAEKDKYGGIVKIAVGKASTSFGYPIKIRGMGQEDASPALEFLVNTTRKGVTEPYLAESWAITPDGKSCTFKLRKGVKFHDGTDFNAQAVKYNLDVWLKTPGPVLGKLKSVDVVDDHTVRLNFSDFDALFLHEMSTEAYMASPTAIEKNGIKWAETHPVGTGPFKLKKYERGVAKRYERFDDYWQKGRPYLDGVEFIVIKDPMTQLSAFKAGEVNAIWSVAKENASLLEKEGYPLQQWPGACVGIWGDSTNSDSPWSKKKVREAVEYAIDKETLMKNLGYGYVPSLYQYVTKEHPFYNPDLKPRMYDPEKAKKLLAEAGYPNGFKTTLTYFAVHWPESWVAIQADLAKVGIGLRLVPVDRAKYMDIRMNGGGLKGGASHTVYMSMGNIIYGLKGYHMSTSGQYHEMVRPEGYDETVKKLLLEKDSGKRRELIFKAVKLFYDEVSFIPLNVEARLAILNKNLHDVDYTTYIHQNSNIFKNAWISK
jgi:peptide/nickel transport system substrate-binding protein